MAVSDDGGDGPIDPVSLPSPSVSRAVGSYFDIAKGTLAVNGSTVTFITTHVLQEMVEDSGKEGGGSGGETAPIEK